MQPPDFRRWLLQACVRGIPSAPATAPCMNESALLNESANLQNADKEVLRCQSETHVASGSCCLNFDCRPVHATGADSDVVSFHHPIAGVALCTFCGGLYMALCWGAWLIVPVLILGKSNRRER